MCDRSRFRRPELSTDDSGGIRINRHDEARRRAVGAGAPADPDRPAGGPPPPDEMVQAVAALLDDLVEGEDDGDRT